MRELDETNVTDYLREVALIGEDETAVVTELSGGVSNVVFYVQRQPASGERKLPDRTRGAADFVVKQARGQLRVAQPWYCSVERIWREVEVLRVAEAVLQQSDGQAGRLPYVLFEDRDNYLFTMTAAPRDSRTWKADLMARKYDASVAAACGSLLAGLHAGTWNVAQFAQSLGDRTYFFDLRVDPYYRRAAEMHDDLRPAIDELIASLDANRCCLVHGDFSPKNLLVWDEGLMLIDCEVGHFGDPAFDLGFFLTHLVAKGIHHSRRRESPATASMPTRGLCETFLQAYAHGLTPAIGQEQYAAVERRAVLNLAGCLLARVDGKSPLEYITSEEDRSALRRIAGGLFAHRPATLSAALNLAMEYSS